MRIPKLVARYGLYYPVSWLQAGNVPGLLAEALKTQYACRQDLNRGQLARLNDLVDHAGRYVPYYGALLGGVGKIDSLGDIRNLPFLTKADIQKHQEKMRSTARLGRVVWKTSGGSTGQPVTVAKTRAALARELAATWRGYAWAGVGIGDSQARFWGVPHDAGARFQARLTDFVCNRRRLSAFDFSEQSLRGYFQAVDRMQPDHFYGYVSMLVEFAEYLNRNRLSLEKNPQAIITTSEVLSESAREILERTFSTRVFNEYGCGELGTIAHECEEGRLHLSEDNLIVEFFDGETPCRPGQAGEIVVTELNNLAMPLIRYRTGDFGTLGTEPCPCGRTLAILEGLHGRAYDMIRTRDGKSFHGEFMLYIFEEIKRQGRGIRQFQVIQEKLDTFLIRIVEEEGFGSETRDFIRRRIQSAIDPAAVVRFESVAAITREKSGKMRLIVGLDSDRSPDRSTAS